MDLLNRRNDRLAERFQARMAGKGIEERVAEVAKIFTENGYMAEWKSLPDGNFIIFQRHCAVHDLATQYRQLCIFEHILLPANFHT